MRPQEGLQGGKITGDGVPFRRLPKAVLDVIFDETLGQILHRAARELGVTEADGHEFVPSWIAFYQPEDEDGYSSTRERSTVELIDESGRAHFGVWFQQPEVTVRAVVESSEAGALEGDPLRPYLILRPGYGNGIFPDWAEYLVAVYVLREVLGTLADAHGAGQMVKAVVHWSKRLLGRFGQAPELIADHAEEWQRRGGWPVTVEMFVDRQPWKAEVLAPLLGCGLDEAEALLIARGFVYDNSTTLWHPNGDQEGRLLRRVVGTIYSLDWELDVQSPEGRTRIREQITLTIDETIASMERDNGD